jgi:hypothetical protein
MGVGEGGIVIFDDNGSPRQLSAKPSSNSGEWVKSNCCRLKVSSMTDSDVRVMACD